MEGIAPDTRLAFSPHFDVHILDERRLLLVSEDRSFLLTGKLYVAIAERMDGSRTVAELSEIFRGMGAPQERIELAFSTLVKKKYAAPVVDGMTMGRSAFWTELEVDPALAERALRATRVAVLAEGSETDVSSLAAALAGAGVAMADGPDADLTVVLVDDYLEPRLAELDTRYRAAGRRWIPIKPAGRVPWIGPVFRPDGPCWACVAKRLTENRPGELNAAGGVVKARVPRTEVPGGREIALSLTALELVRALGGASAAALGGDTILTLDLKLLELTRHTVHRQPACSACGVSAADAADAAPVALQSRRKHATADGGSRTCSPEDALKRLEPHISPLTGIIGGLRECALADGLPVYFARQISPAPNDARTNRRRGRADGAAGKGTTDLQAKVSCLAEAVERYSSGWQGIEARRRSTFAALGEAAVDPRPIMNYSERQYAIREEWNKTNAGFNWIGEPFQDDRPIDWSPVWSLSHGRARWLPTAFCYFNHPLDPEYVFYIAESNGCASGNTIEEAIVQGFMELVERDACALWWYNRVRRPAIDLDSLDDPFFRRARAHYASKGRALYALDLTTDLGIPVVVALAHDADGGRVLTGLGAHLDLRIAASRAVAELNQMAQLDTPERNEQPETDDDRGLRQWLNDATLENQPYLVPAAERTITARDHPLAPTDDILDEVNACLAVVRRAGLEMLVLDMTRREVGFPVVRVTVPGLRHFWARFGPGRLYDVPVKLGWLAKARTEDELNPIPFFL